MSKHEFQDCLYANEWQRHQAIAEAYMTAGGLNNREDMQRFMAEVTNAELADDCIADWFEDGSECDRSELIDAFNELRKDLSSEARKGVGG